MLNDDQGVSGSMPYNLRPLWDAMLEIYEEIRRVCHKEGICFFASGGTVLGAVRHEGFIPWDDDMDFFFRLDQFEKFIAIAPKALPHYMKIVKWGENSDFPFMYAKVQDTRADRLLSVRQKSNLPLPEGIFVDLFPYSGVPSSSLWQRMKNVALRMCRSSVQGGEKTTVMSKIASLGGVCMKPFFHRLKTRDDFFKYQWEYIHSVPSEKARILGFYDCDLCRYTYCCEASWYREAKWMKFDKTEVPVPIEYDKMLKVHYGDYMKLPPGEKRRITHINVPSASWSLG